jgi:hypothetical protein
VGATPAGVCSEQALLPAPAACSAWLAPPHNLCSTFCRAVSKPRPLPPPCDPDCSYVLFASGLPCPHIAAGANLSLPLVGRLLRACGAFFIRRTSRSSPDANLYKAVLAGGWVAAASRVLGGRLQGSRGSDCGVWGWLCGCHAPGCQSRRCHPGAARRGYTSLRLVLPAPPLQATCMRCCAPGTRWSSSLREAEGDSPV